MLEPDSTPISISKPQKWEDLVEEEEKEDQLDQIISASWTIEEFSNWKSLWNLKI